MASIILNLKFGGQGIICQYLLTVSSSMEKYWEEVIQRIGIYKAIQDVHYLQSEEEVLKMRQKIS